MIENLDAVLIDLQDVGARYYTFVWTMYLCLRACQESDVPVVVLDRPNPINGVVTEGPLLDSAYRSFVGLHPLPYATRPEFTGIEVVGCQNGIGLPQPAPYSAAIEITHLIGTRGIEVIGASGRKRIEIS